MPDDYCKRCNGMKPDTWPMCGNCMAEELAKSPVGLGEIEEHTDGGIRGICEHGKAESQCSVCQMDRMEADKRALKAIVRWSLQVVADFDKDAEWRCGAAFGILSQGIRNPERDLLLVNEAPDWLREKYPDVFERLDRLPAE